MHKASKRLFHIALIMVLALCARVANAAACPAQEWPLWKDFVAHFVQDSGRVLDASTALHHSSSEGQSYAMFFALVANDRPLFDKFWGWAVDNLSGGDASRRLPAWIWGQNSDGSWTVIDENSASDASLWFAYALLEAGRLWDEPVYTHHAHALLDLIEREEVADLPGLGAMLLPGRDWFESPEEQRWQLNASYLPLPVVRRLALARPEGPWNDIADNTRIMMEAITPHGFAPDWSAYTTASTRPEFISDPVKGPTGSYDAIRTYLWAGMTSPHDPYYSPMLTALDGMVGATRRGGMPPEQVDVLTGDVSGQGPFGFSAALLPYFDANAESQLLQHHAGRVRHALQQSVEPEALAQGQPPYYDYMLSLFGMGWLDGMFRFQTDGTLLLSWEEECFAINK